MSTTQNQELSNDLMSAFLDTKVTEPIIVKAEDVPLGTGMNFSDIFFVFAFNLLSLAIASLKPSNSK